MSASYATLIGALDLAQRAHDPDWIVFACRFDLADPGFGRQAYAPVTQLPHIATCLLW